MPNGLPIFLTEDLPSRDIIACFTPFLDVRALPYRIEFQRIFLGAPRQWASCGCGGHGPRTIVTPANLQHQDHEEKTE
jgi:hypothetical protein